MQQAQQLLKGAYDLHIHLGPSVIPRSIDMFDALAEADSVGMAGLVAKDHQLPTTAAAILANTHHEGVNGCELFSSIVLNNFVGGLNPMAVEAEIRLGAKVVWLPTIHAANHIAYYGGTEWNHLKASAPLPRVSAGITACDSGGELLPAMRRIIEIVAEHGVCLATGHLHPAEATLICRAAVNAGVKRVVLTHPDFETQAIPLATQIELAALGVMIEKTAIPVTLGHVTIADVAESINAIGAERCLIATDFGQCDNPAVPIGLLAFMEVLHENDVSLESLGRMVKNNARYMLGL